MLERLTTTLDTDARNELFSEAVHLITDRALQIPFSTVTQNWLLRDVAVPLPADKSVPRLGEARWK